ncbi:ABC transporter ATP-binding protein [Bacillus altitudinis]|uniref:ABC transporter ATP-binding protein n=1 Tax=Bacillus altitudinis TaxID=293387 RepID=UPI00045C6761|nr:ABC transporter ATP-binding protein [Bacillus altitudinis]KDE29759.1 ABC transporter ATP-binding protein [Bacillus altitudinis 41KF2b]MEC1042292.1 ABC transporter ATP-binding protein [Bacillus altitudinis]MEC1091846.1 ABC transporter ATP-binding protein [Bacillus altitudinis]
MEQLIEAKQLSLQIDSLKGQKQTILRNIHLTIKRGEFVTIMGPSGCGKTSLLYQLSGIETSSRGEIKYKGQLLSEMTDKQLTALRLSEMGFVFQHSHLLKNLNLFDNIIAAAYLAKKMPRKEVNERAKYLMEKLDIDHLADRYLSEVSGGQLQRASICRALMNKPNILFADEPTGALNSSTTKEVMDIFSLINSEGTTLLLATHDPKVALCSERILFMNDGEISAHLNLGKYDRFTAEKREALLNKWLQNLGF